MVADHCAHLHLSLSMSTSFSVFEVGRSRGIGICCRWAGGSDQIAWVAGQLIARLVGQEIGCQSVAIGSFALRGQDEEDGGEEERSGNLSS